MPPRFLSYGPTYPPPVARRWRSCRSSSSAGEIALATQPAEAELVDRDQRRGAGELIRMDFDRLAAERVDVAATHAVAAVAADE